MKNYDTKKCICGVVTVARSGEFVFLLADGEYWVAFTHREYNQFLKDNAEDLELRFDQGFEKLVFHNNSYCFPYFNPSIIDKEYSTDLLVKSKNNFREIPYSDPIKNDRRNITINVWKNKEQGDN